MAVEDLEERCAFLWDRIVLDDEENRYFLSKIMAGSPCAGSDYIKGMKEPPCRSMGEDEVEVNCCIFPQKNKHPTYANMPKIPAVPRKTIVLLGATNEIRKEIKKELVARHPAQYEYPLQHTSRPSIMCEKHGRDYYFVTEEEIMNDINAGEYLEFEAHEGAMYGTSLATIRRIHAKGRIAILDVSPLALKILCRTEFAPYVVFIAAPPLNNVPDADYYECTKLLYKLDIIRRVYGRFFNLTIVNYDTADTIAQLEKALTRLRCEPQWVSVEYPY